ncbi:MAG: amidohydrolase [Candidatus Helarchaeota archaeon]
MIVKIFHNCKIITMNEKNKYANTMAIYKDRILFIGNEEEVRSKVIKFINEEKTKNLLTIELEEVDLNGKCILPGFIDAHMHPAMYIYFNTQLDLSKVRSYAELEELLRYENNKRRPDEWIVGLGLMEDFFYDPEERLFPTRFDLDSYCPKRPVIIIRHDGHICSVNSVVLEIININETNYKEKLTNSGEIKLDNNGNLLGIFTETATGLILDSIPIPDFNKFKEASKDFSMELASFGITTCGGIVQYGEWGPAGKTGAFEWELLQSLIKENLLEQDFVFYYITDGPKKLLRLKKSLAKLKNNNCRFIVGGIKLFIDGSFGARTAFLYEPFTDSEEKTCGIMVYQKDVLYELAKQAYELDFQVICHAIGDRANREIVNIFQKLLMDLDFKQNRLRIEHASMLTNDVIRDISKSDIILVVQPNFINSEYTWLEKRLGFDRVLYTYPFKSIINSKIILAAASDAPIESANVFEGIYACITRNGLIIDQCISLSDALKMYTINAAIALGQEKLKGSLENGKFADFIILENDIEQITPEELKNLKILETYHRGKKIYSSL